MPRKTHPPVKMSHAWLDKLGPAKKRFDWHDSETHGLVVRHGVSGSRVFYWYGRLHGTMSRLKIGPYPQVTLAKARDEAKRITGEAASGRQPIPVARQARDELTLGDLFGWYLRTHAKPHKSTWEADERRYKARLIQWDHKRLSTITLEMVKDLHVSIGETDGPYAANKMLELLGFMWRLGREQLHFDAVDPTKGIKRFPKTERSRFLTTDELPKFLAALKQVGHQTTRDCILLALFTGARRSNVCAMRWDQIDLKHGIWQIAAASSKNRQELTIILPKAATEILKERKKTAISEWVFPGGGMTGHIVEPKHAMSEALTKAGLKGIRFHDLRRTLGSWQANQGSSLPIIGKSLGHSSTAATRIYARLQMEPVRQSVEAATEAMKAAEKESEK